MHLHVCLVLLAHLETSLLWILLVACSYVNFFLRGTIFTEYAILKLMISDCGVVLPALLTYNKFRMAWYSYLALLDINYAEGFKCSHCSSTPKILIMDAT